MDITKLDQFMQLRPVAADNVRYLAPFEPPLQLEGFAYFSQDHAYHRLPKALEHSSALADREPLLRLGQHTAGGCVRFRSNTGRLIIKAKLRFACGMYHMPATGQGGFDCYLRREEDSWRYAGVTRFEPCQDTYTTTLWAGGDREEKEFLVHFPLYMAVDWVWIGIDEDATVSSPTLHAQHGCAAVYGTSIDQGGCASHPGMAFPAILSRALDLPIYNFGFSGHGWLDLPVADAISEIADLRVLIVDAEANAGPVGTLNQLEDFLRHIRSGSPSTHVLVVSGLPGPYQAQDPGREAEKNLWRQVQRDTVTRLGDSFVTFLDGCQLWPDGGEEFTVDGYHPTDLGLYFMAQNLQPVLHQLLTLGGHAV